MIVVQNLKNVFLIFIINYFVFFASIIGLVVGRLECFSGPTIFHQLEPIQQTAI